MAQIRNIFDFFNVRKRPSTTQLKDITNGMSEKKKRADEKPARRKSFEDMPVEMMWAVFDRMDMESVYKFSATCRDAHRSATGYLRSNLKYDWVQRQFAGFKADEMNSNINFLFRLLHNSVGNRRGCSKNYVSWLRHLPLQCPAVPLPLLLEQCFFHFDNSRASRVYAWLAWEWMNADVAEYLRVFPVTAESPVEHRELEQRLHAGFHSLFFAGDLEHDSKVFVVAVVLQSLASYRHIHKLIFAFFGQRDENGLIPFDAFEESHDGQQPPFGALAEAFGLLMKSSIFGSTIACSPRTIFMILEDLTTSPAMWSMHCFVLLLMQNTDLCILSIRVRFKEGFADDAASVFYYCVRYQRRRSLLFALASRIMAELTREEASVFRTAVLDKSRLMVDSVPQNQPHRLKLMNAAHRRVVEVIDFGFQLHNLRPGARHVSHHH